MRKIIVSEFYTLDGLMSDPQDQMEWVLGSFNEEMGKYESDLYDSADTFDDMEKANRRFQEIGITEMMSRTMSSIKDFPNEAVYAGFSNGGASAQLLAGTRFGAKGCLLFHAALPLNALGIEKWPSGVPVQVPWKNQQFLDQLSNSIHQSGVSFEYFEYPCTGHLFTDPDLPDYDRKSTEILWQQVIRFLQNIKR